MKKKFVFFIIISILISIIHFPQNMFAANGVATVSASVSEISAGQTVTIYVGVSPTLEIDGYDCILTYDANVFEYDGGSLVAGASNIFSPGTLKIAMLPGNPFKAGNIGTLSFKAKSSGNSKFKIAEFSATSVAEDHYISAGNEVSVNVINAPAASPTTTTTQRAPAQTPLAPVETIAPSTTTTTTTEETTTGTTRPFKAVDHAGRSLSIADLSFEELDIPSGYITEERIINGSKLRGYYSDGEDLFLVVLVPSDGEPGFYFYDNVSKSFIPYLRFTLNEEYYHVTYMPESQIPYGTTRKNVEIKGIDLPVLEFNSGEYILLDEYMKQYQERLAENEAGNIDAGRTSGISPDKLTPIDAEVGIKNSGRYLLALQGKDKEIERFFYNESLDQLLHYDFMLMPAFGTFLDENFKDLASENTEGSVLQTEAESVPATDTTVPASSEQTESLLVGTVNLFGRYFKLWQIIAAAALLLFIIVLVIVMIVRAAARRGRAEYPFSEDFLADDPKQISENTHSYVEDDLDAENFRSIDYNYPDDFPEVSELSDTDLEEDYFNEDYQANQYSERSEQEDQEEI